MTTETKSTISKRGVNVDEWRKENGMPPLNAPDAKIIACVYFPKHDPAILETYVKTHKLPF